MNLVLFCYESESHLVVSDSATSWTIAHQALLSMGFPSQEYWTRLPFPSPRDLPDPGIEPGLLLWRQSLYSLNTRATLSVYGKMQKSGLIEVIPLIYTSAIWNWYPVLFYPEFPQGLPTGHPLFTDMASNIFHSQVIIYYIYNIDFPKWLSGKESTCLCRRCRRCGFNPWVRKISWRRKWQPTPVFLPGKSHGQKSLVGYSPWRCRELDMTKWLSMHKLKNKDIWKKY